MYETHSSGSFTSVYNGLRCGNQDPTGGEPIRNGSGESTALKRKGNDLGSEGPPGFLLLCFGLLSIFLLTVTFSGCDSRNPSPAPGAISTTPGAPQIPAIDLPPGTEVRVTQRETQDGGVEFQWQKSSGSSAGLSTESPEVAATFNTSAPTSGATGSMGGATELEMKLGGKKNLIIFIVIGSVLLLGSGFCVYRGLLHAALIGGVMGAGFIIVGMWPVTIWWIMGGLVIACLVAVLSSDELRHRFRESLRAVSAGIEDLNDDDRAKVKAKVQSHASEGDVRTIRSIKKKDGLPSERHPGAK